MTAPPSQSCRPTIRVSRRHPLASVTSAPSPKPPITAEPGDFRFERGSRRLSAPWVRFDPRLRRECQLGRGHPRDELLRCRRDHHPPADNHGDVENYSDSALNLQDTAGNECTVTEIQAPSSRPWAPGISRRWPQSCGRPSCSSALDRNRQSLLNSHVAC